MTVSDDVTVESELFVVEQGARGRGPDEGCGWQGMLGILGSGCLRRTVHSHGWGTVRTCVGACTLLSPRGEIGWYWYVAVGAIKCTMLEPRWFVCHRLVCRRV